MNNDCTPNKRRATLTLMITHQCNLNCLYCYEKNKHRGQIITMDVAKRAVAMAFDRFKDDFEELEIDFMGGEPLMEFELVKQVSEWIWTRQWPIPYVLFATTNGTLLNKERKEWFKLHKEQFVLSLSCDGTENMQNQNRSNSAKYIDVGFFASTWPFQPAKMTISPYTINNLSEGVKFINSEGIARINANLAFGEKWEAEHLSQYNKQMLALVDHYTKNPDIPRVSLLNENLKVILSNPYDAKYCGAGTGIVFVDTDGREYPCHILSPLTLTQKQIAFSNGLDYSDSDLFTSSKCKQCILYNLCPQCLGMNYIHHGAFKVKDEFSCAATKIQVLANARLNYKLLCMKKDYSSEDRQIALAIRTISQSKFN